jgi:mevalonate kinase
LTLPTGHGHGHGKLILCGEHAVVYGHPAIAFAVNKGTRVTAQMRPGALEVLSSIDDPALRQAVELMFGDQGWTVTIESDVPLGRGMGSSAALAVALAKAHAEAISGDTSHAGVMKAAMPIERHFHGNPSGIDVAVALHGHAMRFLRGPPMAWNPLPFSSWHLVVLDSQQRGNTKDQVARIAESRPGSDPLLSAIGQLVSRVEEVLDQPDELGPLLSENHRLLQRLGVSTPRLDELVDFALQHDALGAKLSGAGGGGVVFALLETPAHVDRLCRAATQSGVVGWACQALEGPHA